MDPLTQGLVGAAAAQACFQKRLPRSAWIIGFLAAMAPDLDVLIRSAEDPTVGWTFHRHLTHSLAFIPIGGILFSAPFLLFPKLRDEYRAVFGAGIVAVATHGLLDACTSYGTQLLLPFSDERIAWDIIGIIDFFFTPVLLLGVVASALTQHAAFARGALAVAALYLAAGSWQHHRAEQVQLALAEARGHEMEHQRVLPSPGTLVLWRSVYIAEGQIHMDGVRTPWLSEPLVAPGEAALQASVSHIELEAGANAAHARRSFQTFKWFADGFVARVPESNVFVDARYSADATALLPLWGLEIDPYSGNPARHSPPPEEGRAGYAGALWATLTEGDPRYQPVESALAELDPPPSTPRRQVPPNVLLALLLELLTL